MEFETDSGKSGNRDVEQFHSRFLHPSYLAPLQISYDTVDRETISERVQNGRLRLATPESLERLLMEESVRLGYALKRITPDREYRSVRVGSSPEHTREEAALASVQDRGTNVDMISCYAHRLMNHLGPGAVDLRILGRSEGHVQVREFALAVEHESITSLVAVDYSDATNPFITVAEDAVPEALPGDEYELLRTANSTEYAHFRQALQKRSEAAPGGRGRVYGLLRGACANRRFK